MFVFLKGPGGFRKIGYLLGALALLAAGCERLGLGGPNSGEGFELSLVRDPGEAGKLEVVVTSEEAWIEVVNPLEIDWEAVLSLRLIKEDGGELPTLGTYELRPFDLYFRPVYPLLPGRKYVARFEVAALPGFEGAPPHEMATSYEAPDEHLRHVPQVVGFYPSGVDFPQNHLKFHLVFSEPMQGGRVFEQIMLLGKDDVEVADPFRETESWSEDGTRLTIWLDPERQQRSANVDATAGPVLMEGQEYRLLVSGKWKSKRGVALGRDNEKPMIVGPVDRVRVDTSAWEVTAPRRGTRGRLKLKFPEPYDWMGLQSEMRLETVDGVPVAGRIEVGVKERSWFFVPEKEWEAGNYRIAVATAMEDLAGNSLARRFEVGGEDGDEGDRKDIGTDEEEVGDEVFVTFRVK